MTAEGPTSTSVALSRQRRARKIAMSEDELDEYLRSQRTCRFATTGPTGPHLTPLWFVWDGSSFWFWSLFRSQRWRDIERSARVAVLVDDGSDYTELRGVEATGDARPVGQAPHLRTDDPVLARCDQLFADKYLGGTPDLDGRHAWLRLDPIKLSSWDFRKLPGS